MAPGGFADHHPVGPLLRHPHLLEASPPQLRQRHLEPSRGRPGHTEEPLPAAGDVGHPLQRRDYPPLLPYLVALFPDKRALGASKYIPAVFDTLSCAFTGIFLHLLPSMWVRWPVDPTALGLPVGPELVLPALGMLIWTFTPMTAIDTFQHLSPRPMGNFFMVLTVILMFLFHRDPRWEYLALMVVPVALILIRPC